jgi:hypothetical protein
MYSWPAQRGTPSDLNHSLVTISLMVHRFVPIFDILFQRRCRFKRAKLFGILSGENQQCQASKIWVFHQEVSPLLFNAFVAFLIRPELWEDIHEEIPKL